MLNTTVVVAVSAVDDAAQHLDRALAEVLVQHQEEERVDEGVDEADVERHLVRHRVLGLLPVARVVGQSHLTQVLDRMKNVKCTPMQSDLEHQRA